MPLTGNSHNHLRHPHPHQSDLTKMPPAMSTRNSLTLCTPIVPSSEMVQKQNLNHSKESSTKHQTQTTTTPIDAKVYRKTNK